MQLEVRAFSKPFGDLCAFYAFTSKGHYTAGIKKCSDLEGLTACLTALFEEKQPENIKIYLDFSQSSLLMLLKAKCVYKYDFLLQFEIDETDKIDRAKRTVDMMVDKFTK